MEAKRLKNQINNDPDTYDKQLQSPSEIDAILVEAAKHDPEAFGQLYDRYFNQIYRFVYSRVQDQTAAEDITSEVFMKALKNLDRYKHRGYPFSAWLYQIAVNAIADTFRSQKPVIDIEEAYGLHDSQQHPEDEVLYKDEIERIWQAVEKLPHTQKVAIVLKFQEDLKIEEIAKIMDKTPGAVKLLIHRGLERVRQHLSKPEGAIKP
jgi:RNA polymerase sigma-70 factor (ECF subfamily)